MNAVKHAFFCPNFLFGMNFTFSSVLLVLLALPCFTSYSNYTYHNDHHWEGFVERQSAAFVHYHKFRSGIVYPSNYHFDYSYLDSLRKQWVENKENLDDIVKYVSDKYRERYLRQPPKNFDKWVEIVLKNNGELNPQQYDQIDQDFRPFRDPKNPNRKTFNTTMIESWYQKASDRNNFVYGYKGGGNVALSSRHNGEALFEHTIINLGKDILPEKMSFIFGKLDEPTNIDLDHEENEVHQFDGQEVPDHKLFRRNQCMRETFLTPIPANFSTDSKGIGHWHYFFTDWSKQPKVYNSFYYKPFPIFARCKITCFKDVIIPYGDYHAKLYNKPNNIPWDQKADKVVFRGQSSGAIVDKDQRYKNALRFRLVDWAKSLQQQHQQQQQEHYEVDVSLSKIVNCLDWPTCQQADAEYARGGLSSSILAQARYMIIIDGNTWADRMDHQLLENSTLLWGTLYLDWKYHRLRPFREFLPFLLEERFDSLTRVIHWAENHLPRAREIAENGRKFAERYFRVIDYQLYTLLALLEYAELYEDV